jgi:Zn-dependent protease with chaperone function
MESGADEKLLCKAVQPEERSTAFRSPLLSFLKKKTAAPGQGACPGAQAEDAGGLAQGFSGIHALKAVALAALGYVYICGVLLVLSLLFVHAVFFVVRSPDPPVFLLICSPYLLVIMVLLYGSLRTVWIRPPVPEGFRITSSDAPWLSSTLDLIRLELKGPKIHRVLLTGDFKAFIARVPRAGIFGWHRNYLVLGLPLLQALSTRQMLAVLAHEYSHLPGGRDRLGAWVCGLRKSWTQILARLQHHRGFKEILLARFFLWYAPYFHAATMPLARVHEFKADLCSVALAGKDGTAAALIRYEVFARYLHESFWPTVYSLMDTLPEPVPSVYGLMQDKLVQGPDKKMEIEWLEASLSREANPYQTHPRLAERLQAIDENPALPPSPCQSAAQFYFPNLDEVRSRLDQEWRTLVDGKWRERYGHFQKAKARLSELVSRARAQPLNAGETLELAGLTEELSGRDEAIPFYQRILEYMPWFVPALCALGRICLAQGDEAGAGYIEKAMALDPGYRVSGLETLYNFYMGKGDREKTGEYYQRLSEQRQQSIERARRSGRSQRLPARYMVTRRKDSIQGMPHHHIV